MTMNEKVAQVQSLHKQGMTKTDAIKKVGISGPTFYKHAKKIKPKKARKAKPRILVQEFASVAQANGRLFMVFGDTASLQEFARGIS